MAVIPNIFMDDYIGETLHEQRYLDRLQSIRQQRAMDLEYALSAAGPSLQRHREELAFRRQLAMQQQQHKDQMQATVAGSIARGIGDGWITGPGASEFVRTHLGADYDLFGADGAPAPERRLTFGTTSSGAPIALPEHFATTAPAPAPAAIPAPAAPAAGVVTAPTQGRPTRTVAVGPPVPEGFTQPTRQVPVDAFMHNVTTGRSARIGRPDQLRAITPDDGALILLLPPDLQQLVAANPGRYVTDGLNIFDTAAGPQPLNR